MAHRGVRAVHHLDRDANIRNMNIELCAPTEVEGGGGG